MKSNTKSSITLPPERLKLVISLQARLKAAYRRSSLATRKSLARELKDFDALAAEGLD